MNCDNTDYMLIILNSSQNTPKTPAALQQLQLAGSLQLAFVAGQQS